MTYNDLGLALPSTPAGPRRRPWRVLIVDDEPDIHAAARLALAKIEFQGRVLELVSCYSAAEAATDLEAHPETALALVDVVMERECAGLELVRTIREQLHNHLVRIVIVTGNPGQAPEREVVRDYDINDYHEKTEMGVSRFYAVVVNALRGYSALISLERSRNGLARVAEASGGLFTQESGQRLLEALLQEMSELLGIMEGGWLLEAPSMAVLEQDVAPQLKIVAALGRYAAPERTAAIEPPMPAEGVALTTAALRDGGLHADKKLHLLASGIPTQIGPRRIIYLEGLPSLTSGDLQFIRLLLDNTGRAHDQLTLRHEMEFMQRQTLLLLCEAIELRSGETGNHVRRVGEMAALLGELCGLTAGECALLLAAAPLHDVGKITIPDAVLNKPGKFSEDEWRIMRGHSHAGHDLLSGHAAPWLTAAAEIALTHHERWDGGGYPRGLAGEAIPRYGRIVKIVDVFDALLSKRCYKDAWPIERVLELFRAGAGTEFDPALTALLLDHMPRFVEINQRLPD